MSVIGQNHAESLLLWLSFIKTPSVNITNHSEFAQLVAIFEKKVAQKSTNNHVKPNYLILLLDLVKSLTKDRLLLTGIILIFVSLSIGVGLSHFHKLSAWGKDIMLIAVIIGYSLFLISFINYLCREYRNMLINPQKLFVKNLGSFGVEQIKQAIEIQKHFSSEKIEAILTYAEISKDKYKGRVKLITCGAVFLATGFFGKEFLNDIHVPLEDVAWLLKISSYIGVFALLFAFVSVRPSMGATDVCAALKLASKHKKEQLEELIAFFERKN